MTKGGPAIQSQVQQLLAAAAQDPLPPYETLTPEQARDRVLAFLPSDAPAVAVGRTVDDSIATDAGPLAIRLYYPLHDTAENDAHPAVLFFHGGGWVICNLDTHDDLCRRICAGLNAVVISVDYRLSPEVPFPGAVSDCGAALEWVRTNCSRLGIDPAQIIVAGDSAGGNLAAVTAIAAKDEDAPALAGQILFYPVTDLGAEHPSYHDHGPDLPLTGPTMRWFRSHYLGTQDGLDWRASPLRAESLAGAPPAFVLTVEHDPLRDEGVAYARKLALSGCEVTHAHMYNQVHGFLNLAMFLSDAPAAIAMALDWAKAVLARAKG